MVNQKYYSTRHWIKFSKSLLDDKECICEICKRPRWKLMIRGKKKGQYRRLLRFSVHHKSYKNIYHEQREDVLLLCSFCHKTAHAALRGQNASDFHKKFAQLFLDAGFIYNPNEVLISGKEEIV